MPFKFARGVYVEDLITGFKGMIICRQDHITNCNAYYVKPSVDKDGKDVEGKWIDEHALKVDTTKQQFKLSQEETVPPG